MSLVNIARLAARTKTELDQRASLDLAVKSAVSKLESLTGKLWDAREDHALEPILVEPSDVTTYLPAMNVTEVALTEWASTQVEDDAVDVDPTAFQVSPRRGRLTRLRSAYWLGWLRATVTCGYDAGTCPPDVSAALEVQAAFELIRWQPEKAVVLSQAFGKGSSASYENDGMVRPFRDIVAMYS